MSPVAQFAEALVVPTWFTIGWGGSTLMLLIGLVVGAHYYKPDKFPDVDRSPETNRVSTDQ
jgi:hypothetical protein